jgi:lipid II:glycine glycyltransferase (peptidoglycan interpeptide bridge formation enzyme)
MDRLVTMPAEDDREWDAYLAAQPAGHYTQSSPWGLLKAKFGWQVARLLVKEGEQIVGGAQLLLRRLPLWGRIGYISKGPVVSAGRMDVMEQLLGEIESFARKNAVLLVSIQPPSDLPEYMQPMFSHGYRLSSYYIVPPTTVLIDLTKSENEILSQMKRTTRQNIRTAQSRGVLVQEGGEADLPAFCRLKQMTESRSEFVHYSQEYYQEAWRQFELRGAMKLWLAYFGQELLAGLMAVYFGHWVVYAWAGSTRQHVDKRPNDLLFWHAMMWGKQQGYHFCDLGGISPIVADALLKNSEPPDCKEKGIARYKLGFGPMQTFPSSYDSIFILRPRWLVRKVINFAWSSNRKGVSRFVRGVRS